MPDSRPGSCHRGPGGPPGGGVPAPRGCSEVPLTCPRWVWSRGCPGFPRCSRAAFQVGGPKWRVPLTVGIVSTAGARGPRRWAVPPGLWGPPPALLGVTPGGVPGTVRGGQGWNPGGPRAGRMRYPLCYRSTPRGGLFLFLFLFGGHILQCSGITAGDTQGLIRMLGVKPESAMCRTSALPPVLLLQPLIEVFKARNGDTSSCPQPIKTRATSFTWINQTCFSSHVISFVLMYCYKNG